MKYVFALALSLISLGSAAAAPTPARTFGAVGDGSTDNAVAFAAMFASTASPTVMLGPGTFNLSCGHAFTAASAISLIGAGQGRTVIRLQGGCTLAKDLFAWDGRSGVSIRNLTLDLNTPAPSPTPHAAIVGYAYSGSATGFVIDHVSVINGTSPTFLVNASAARGHTYNDVRITNNRLTLTRAATSQNQCIALSTVNGAGAIPGAIVSHNVCVNSAIQIDGEGTQVIGNDISGWQFGTGIFAAFNTGAVTEDTVSSRNCLIAGNVMHDAPNTHDVNRTATGGLENNCVNSRVIGNQAYNLGGAGFFNFASGATYINNVAHDVGRGGDGGAGGGLDTAGFAVEDNGSPNAVYHAQNVTLSGNKAYNTPHGYMEEPSHHFSSTLKANTLPDVVKARP